MNLDQIIEQIKLISMEYGPKIIIAVIIWIIGLWTIKILNYGFGRMLDKRNIDPTLKPFIKGFLSAILKVLLIVSLLGTIGIEMTSFVAIIGAAGLAIGLALYKILQEVLSSYCLSPIRLVTR